MRPWVQTWYFRPCRSLDLHYLTVAEKTWDFENKKPMNGVFLVPDTDIMIFGEAEHREHILPSRGIGH